MTPFKFIVGEQIMCLIDYKLGDICMFTKDNIYKVRNVYVLDNGNNAVEVEQTDLGTPGSHLEKHFRKMC